MAHYSPHAKTEPLPVVKPRPAWHHPRGLLIPVVGSLVLLAFAAGVLCGVWAANRAQERASHAAR